MINLIEFMYNLCTYIISRSLATVTEIRSLLLIPFHENFLDGSRFILSCPFRAATYLHVAYLHVRALDKVIRSNLRCKYE